MNCPKCGQKTLLLVSDGTCGKCNCADAERREPGPVSRGIVKPGLTYSCIRRTAVQKAENKKVVR